MTDRRMSIVISRIASPPSSLARERSSRVDAKTAPSGVARELSELGARVFGVSTQTPAEQLEAAERLHRPSAVPPDRNARDVVEWLRSE